MNKPTDHANRARRTPSRAKRRRGSAVLPAALTELPEAQLTSTAAPDGETNLDPDGRHAMIAETAYYRAENRGFARGLEIDDWLAAERDIEHLLPVAAASMVDAAD